MRKENDLEGGGSPSLEGLPTLLPPNPPLPEPPVSPAVARHYCERLARSHYENFTVVSWFLPRERRPHFYNLYAYCRWADDLGDETGDAQRSLALLDWWEEELRACYAGRPRHAVFVALAETVRQLDIPMEPFANLLKAFRQDQTTPRYRTYEELLGYCENSANPVGRLVLALCGYQDAEQQRLSDCTCTALQLANFWQDVSVDLAKGRIYLPLEDVERFGCTEAQICERRFSPEFAELMRFEVERAWALFAEGAKLGALVDKRVRMDIGLFTRGGQAILRLIERQGYDVLTRRPALSRAQKVALIAGHLLASLR